MDKKTFKSCMSLFGTGIAVVTTKYKEQSFGITINSFCSVSLDPPMILYCIDKNANRFTQLYNTEKFFINILSSDQKDISIAFSKNDKKKWSTALDNDLKIDGSCCVLECETKHRYEGGDHKIIVAKVKSCLLKNESLNPLIYHKSNYCYIK